MMTRNTLATLVTALALVLPASFVMMQPQAEAAGGVLKSANSDGKRVHKRANAKRSSSKKTTKRKKVKRSSSNTSNRRVVNRTSRTSRPARTTRTTRTTRTSRPTRTRTTRTRSGRTTRRHVRTSPRRTRTVHNRRSRSSHTHSHTSSSSNSSGSKSNIDAYITGGIGTSGFDSQRISDLALPGLGYNIAVGAKGKYLGFEFGLDGGGYTFDPDEGGTDMSYFGLFGDLKLQPTLDIFEPFIFAGVGGYLLGDGIVNETSEGAAFRAGVGANLRIDDFAVGLKYTWATFSFTDSSGIYGGDFGAQTETVGVNLSLYF